MSGPVSKIEPHFTLLEDDSPPASTRLSLSDAPQSGPVSGHAAPVLFRGDAGPGFWIRDQRVSVEAVFVRADLATCRVIRLSPTGAWFSPGRGTQYPTNEQVELFLHAAGQRIGPLWARVVMPPDPAQEPIFGLMFTGLQFAVAQQIVGLLRDLAGRGAAHLAHQPQHAREEIVDEARIRAILLALVGAGSRGFVGARREAPVSIVALQEHGVLEWQGVHGWGEPPYVVELIGYNSVYRIHVPERHVLADGRVLTPLPTRIDRARKRQYRRSQVDGTLTASLHHPLWPRLGEIRREVRDVSFAGISFATSLEDDLLFPGLSLHVIELRDTLHYGDYVRLKGEVRYVGIAGGEAVARVSVSPASPRDEVRWNRLVSRLLYPTTDSSAEWAEPVWQLFHDSGYFNLSGKVPRQFDELKSSFMRMDDVAAHNPKLFCNAVFPAEDAENTVEGTVSIMKAYRGTWMLHQLAKRRGHGDALNSRRVLRDLYTRAFEHAQTDGGFRWVIAYAEATVRWNHLSHFAFAERHMETGKAIALPFQLLEADSRASGLRVPAVAEVGVATDEDLALLLDHVRSRRPACYLDALDLTAESVNMHDVRRDWHRVGLARERCILTARRDDVVVAAAILECSETGANLFRLCDCVRLIPLAPGGEAALPSLLEMARRWFAKRNKHAFVYFREDEDPGPDELARLRDLGEGRLWVMAAELLPEFLEHLFEITSPRRMTAKQAQEAAPGRFAG